MTRVHHPDPPGAVGDAQPPTARMVRAGTIRHLHPLGRLLGAGLGRADRRARCGAGERVVHATTRTRSGTSTPSASPAVRPHSTISRSTAGHRTTTSSMPGRPRPSTRRIGRDSSQPPAPSTSSRPPSITTGSPSGTHPGPATRNTVHRGPRRDLIAEIASAVRAEGMRFGVYYSGGLDWSITNLPPITSAADLHTLRPIDAAYNTYAYLHVRRPDHPLRTRRAVERHRLAGRRQAARPLLAFMIFCSITTKRFPRVWSMTAGASHTGTSGPASTRPRGRTSGAGRGRTAAGSASRSATTRWRTSANRSAGTQLAEYLTDVVSRGGRLLLNVGPTAEGLIPPVQRQALEELGRMR